MYQFKCSLICTLHLQHEGQVHTAHNVEHCYCRSLCTCKTVDLRKPLVTSICYGGLLIKLCINPNLLGGSLVRMSICCTILLIPLTIIVCIRMCSRVCRPLVLQGCGIAVGRCRSRVSSGC